jgi:hypothetical protein
MLTAMMLSDFLSAIHRIVHVVFSFGSAIWLYRVHCIIESEIIFVSAIVRRFVTLHAHMNSGKRDDDPCDLPLTPGAASRELFVQPSLSRTYSKVAALISRRNVRQRRGENRKTKESKQPG